MSSYEFQVIILAVDNTSAKLGPIDENLPHVMLPVANRPILSYQLEMLERSGFKSVLIVTQDYAQNRIAAYVNQVYKDQNQGKLEVEFFVLKDQNQIGTCEILYRIREKIRTNFMVITGNLIADEGFIRQMADLHRGNDSSLTMMLYPKKVATTEVKETTDSTYVDYIVLDEKTNRILQMEPATDIEDAVLVSKQMLRHFPNIVVNNNLQDAQFYVFSRWVIDLIIEEQKTKNIPITSIKKQLIPLLLQCQIPGHGKKLPATSVNRTQDLALSMSTSATPFNPSYHINQNTQDTIKCLTYLTNGYSININTIQNYTQANRDVASGQTSYKPYEAPGKNNYIDVKAQVAPTSVGADCVIGTESILGPKCSVKKSIIGKHCKFGQSVRIENAIIMDYVTIEDHCGISGSIIGNNVYIKTKSVKDSQIASGFTVSKGNALITHLLSSILTYFPTQLKSTDLKSKQISNQLD
ncbi:hypothetical protein SAMD00019534_002510 [Acytostelium subglobosum LB1]|uniref:hypothetical protein n=1 Tax=Acytostelium subglobosum LB1 TaxID=1410327 RepID=UPI0006451DEA|nr:hypothetical protein SAMD00019534_002510 [Acytostelium subglobosum LB1]GAM17076.1 hypothetical protein SAMD00019534_002510 [Acytostelium subglobosum LB1]|eukprot:XP_012759138.1 hypothetical protein SAMD00019534_002510 [Acytostelium subglobosum LB1]